MTAADATLPLSAEILGHWSKSQSAIARSGTNIGPSRLELRLGGKEHSHLSHETRNDVDDRCRHKTRSPVFAREGRPYPGVASPAGAYMRLPISAQ